MVSGHFFKMVPFAPLKWSAIFKMELIITQRQRRHHGEDWGGHVLPNIFQDRFFNSSKSEEKYVGGGYDGGT